MLIITRTKKPQKYKIPEMPDFKDRHSKVFWLRRQRMLATLTNIKSVSVQVRDIKQMIYTKNSRLLSLYTKLSFSEIHYEAHYNDNDYITISKSKGKNNATIYALITTDWLINLDDLKTKSDEEIQQECTAIENEISKLKALKEEKEYSYYNIDNRIKLLQYKLFCLTEYLSKKDIQDKETQPNKKVKK